MKLINSKNRHTHSNIKLAYFIGIVLIISATLLICILHIVNSHKDKSGALKKPSVVTPKENNNEKVIKNSLISDITNEIIMFENFIKITGDYFKIHKNISFKLLNIVPLYDEDLNKLLKTDLTDLNSIKEVINKIRLSIEGLSNTLQELDTKILPYEEKTINIYPRNIRYFRTGYIIFNKAFETFKENWDIIEKKYFIYAAISLLRMFYINITLITESQNVYPNSFFMLQREEKTRLILNFIKQYTHFLIGTPLIIIGISHSNNTKKEIKEIYNPLELDHTVEEMKLPIQKLFELLNEKHKIESKELILHFTILNNIVKRYITKL